MRNHISQRLAACCMSLVLLISLCTPLALAEENQNVIHLTSIQDWEKLVRSCRLDTWSQNKTVVLDCDLDLSSAVSIPTFGGTFDGAGHTISGFRSSRDEDHQALFRYVQEGAVVKDLTLKGHILPGSNSDAIGGIVGINSGTLENCVFEGAVSGGSNVGGIAGINEASGQLLRCSNRPGSVTGEHNTGGIAGSNYGSVVGCTNAAQVNTKESSISPEPGSVDWKQLNSTENLSACTDTGGVVGYSTGVVKDSSNSGTIGYPHTGYNVGGVVGRQAGYMTGCSNSGLIQGRKDVGGIVGQMEPYTLLHYDEDTLHKLAREFDVLASYLTDSLDSTDNTRHQISEHITTITSHTGQAKDHIRDLLKEVEALGDETVDTVNELSRRVSRLMDQLSPVSKDMERAADTISDALSQMEDALDTADAIDPKISAAVSDLKSAAHKMESGCREISQLLADIPGLLEELINAPDIPSIAAGIIHTLRTISNRLSSAVGDMQQAFREFQNAADSLDGISSILKRSSQKIQDALSDLSSGSSFIADAFEDLGAAIDEQNALPDLEFPKLGAEFHEKEDQLNDTLSALNDELEKMNQTANQGGDDLSEQLRKVNKQFGVINKTLRSISEEDPTDKELVVDVSKDYIASATQGKVHNCQNTGQVDGDVNIGGIAGSMAIEYDFDPEDDIVGQRKNSVNAKLLTRVILQGCVNRGCVVSRKDCIGGAVGWADLGVIVECQNYGCVESTSGKYIGGIAGSSNGAIRSCWAKCSLTGSRLVGGIAGYAADIQDCHSLVQINDASSYVGAIAGDIDPKGSLSNNTFISETLGGLDGISYTGKTTPLSYEEFMAQPNVPADFQSLQLIFMADDKELARLSVPYGGAVDASQLPIVPAKEGFYGSWSEFDRDCLLFDATVNATYSPMLSTVASSDGTVLAEGAFTPNAVLTVSNSTTPPPTGKAGEMFGPFLVESNEAFTAVRIALPKDILTATLLALDENGTWQEIDSTRNGSYLRAELSGDHVELCMLCTPSTVSGWIVVPLLGVFILFLHYLFKRRHQRRGMSNHAKTQQQNETKTGSTP